MRNPTATQKMKRPRARSIRVVGSILLLPVMALVGCLESGFSVHLEEDVAPRGDGFPNGDAVPADGVAQTDGGDLPETRNDIHGFDGDLRPCGDGVCDAVGGEDGQTCPEDCCACGDGACDLSCGETEWTCKDDCCVCGDGKCLGMEGTCGEGPATCPADCTNCGDEVCAGNESWQNCLVDCCGGCGDGKCKGGECGEDPVSCPEDCGKYACGNLVCDPGEDPFLCTQDCVHDACGNGVCEPEEDSTDCPHDCTPSCGDCLCTKGESNDTCPQDCGYCGDGYCTICPSHGEGPVTCTQDCCNDWNPCTADGVAMEGDLVVCTHGPDNTGDCEHVLPCTIGDSCVAGACVAGPGPFDCDDGDPCTDDSCDPVSGTCAHSFNEASCDKDCPPDEAGTCVGGVCQCG